jgi:hypothetical protein
MTNAPRTALACGVVGKFGETLLEALLASPRYSAVYVATRSPLTSTLTRLRPLPLSATWEAEQLPAIDDVYCCVDQRPGFYGRDRAYLPAQRAQLPAIASIARRAGALRFVLLTATAPIEQLSAPQGGVQDGNELALVRSGFETLVLMRPADTGRPASGNALEWLMHAIGGTLISYLIPQSMQPLRPHLVARAALEAPERLGTGTHVLNAPAIRRLLGMEQHARAARRRLRG